eukprot:556849-Prymnesium_polylepis.2
MQHDPFCSGCNRTDAVLDAKYCGDMTPCLTPCEIEEVRAEGLSRWSGATVECGEACARRYRKAHICRGAQNCTKILRTRSHVHACPRMSLSTLAPPPWQLAYLNKGSRTLPPWMHAYEMRQITKSEHWICRYSDQGMALDPREHLKVFVAALHVAMLQMGGGVGSIVPENTSGESRMRNRCRRRRQIVANALTLATRNPQSLWSSSCALCSALSYGPSWWVPFASRRVRESEGASALGDCSSPAALSTADHPKCRWFLQFLTDLNIPHETRIKTREYLRQARYLSKHQAYIELVDNFSHDIRNDLVLRMSSATLNAVWYLADCGKECPEFIIDLALKLDRTCWAPKEKISAVQLNIIMRGVVAKAGNIMTEGSYWGEDIIITVPVLRDSRGVSTLSYVEVCSLSRDDVEESLVQFPDANDSIRKAAVLLATNRASKVIAEYYRLHAADKLTVARSRVCTDGKCRTPVKLSRHLSRGTDRCEMMRQAASRTTRQYQCW